MACNNKGVRAHHPRHLVSVAALETALAEARESGLPWEIRSASNKLIAAKAANEQVLRSNLQDRLAIIAKRAQAQKVEA